MCMCVEPPHVCCVCGVATCLCLVFCNVCGAVTPTNGEHELGLDRRETG